MFQSQILDWSKLKAFADDKIIVVQKLNFVDGRVKNIVEKGEKACYQHIFIYSQCFQKSFILGGHLKLGLCGKGLIIYLFYNYQLNSVFVMDICYHIVLNFCRFSTKQSPLHAQASLFLSSNDQIDALVSMVTTLHEGMFIWSYYLASSFNTF